MRKRRELLDGARYHVSSRVVRQARFLDHRGAKELFLSVITAARRKYRFSVENFCLMGNHYHLVIRPARGESLSCIMRWILGVFAQRYNRLTGTAGIVWGGRFFSRILRSLREYLIEFEYMDANPVRAGLVTCDWHWAYGGLWHHRAGRRDVVERPPPWIALLLPRHRQLLIGPNKSRLSRKERV